MKPLRRILTEDGSYTLKREDLGETYHSQKGAITESEHVYLSNGFRYAVQNKNRIAIAEIGFGTGLNALLTALERHNGLEIIYYGIDTLPLDSSEMEAMHYEQSVLHPEAAAVFRKIAHSPWQFSEKPIAEAVRDGFYLAKIAVSVRDLQLPEKVDLIYYDAFAPKYKPEMWEPVIFEHLATQMNPDGILVTYCAQGKFRRNLQALGWTVERVPVAGGLKNEMIRARRPD
jgi:tRNA U34 5-methylaminomethyl-2-thiouridine-forming methyltransferase MnmC